jgi:hypothetical protein
MCSTLHMKVGKHTFATTVRALEGRIIIAHDCLRCAWLCLQNLSDDDATAAAITVCAMTVLVRNGGPGGEPDPQALDELLAAGGIPALLSITSPSDEAALATIELLHLIVREPRTEAEVAAADCARLLITALGAAFRSSIDDERNKGKADARAHVVDVIGRLVEGRPDLAQALLTAGMAGEVAHFLAPARDVVERNLAMQLVEKLIRHAPGMCNALKVEGVFTHIHQLTRGAPKDIGGPILGMGEGALLPEATDDILEGEPLQAIAVLCMAAGHCGGVLEVANVDGEPTRYSTNGVIPPSPGTPQVPSIPPPTTLFPEASPPPSPGTPEASPPTNRRPPEAAPAQSLQAPEANATPSPGVEEACSCASPGTADTGLPASPGTLAAASADAVGHQKPPQSSAGTPEVATAQAPPHAKVRRPSRRVCSMCGAVSEQRFQVCTRCRRAAYCGRACQAAHWPVHKIECRD